MKLTLVALFIGIATFSRAQDPEPGDRGLVPLQPQQLLAVLPKAREGWTMKMSRASNGVEDWLTSQAVRQFEFPPEDEDRQPALARISIIDTAKEGSSLEKFADFVPGEVEEGVEGLLVDGMPAYRSSYGPIVEFEILVDDRFVIEIMLKHREKSDLKEWLKLFDVARLRGAASDSQIIDFPGLISVIEIDELNPDESHSYLLSMSTGNEIERQLIEEEKLQQMIDEAIAEGKDLEELDLSELE